MEDRDSHTPAYAIELAWGGKLPSMGDFVWSDARTPLRTGLDNWLQAGIQQLRLTLGDDWESSFDLGLMWNFIVPAGVLGPGCVAGCISPSCDRVRRRFPFAMAYSFSPQAPAWYLSKAMDAMPSLLSRTGTLLFNGIRRQWPRETLVTLVGEALLKWQQALVPMASTGLNALDSDSVILSVLVGERESSGSNDGVSTLPSNRFATLPWSDAVNSLVAQSNTSFWWTNGAGGAALKAFTYGACLDGALMTWLFGHPPV
ncbi:MAG: type VI secretion system-associated protein TagF [Gallionellaceae bacterium]|jgi:type VI secretion system ImpM family protein|nr:type VI secretion system-associated protein TagF [Gallionellaceae bacterium]